MHAIDELRDLENICGIHLLLLEKGDNSCDIFLLVVNNILQQNPRGAVCIIPRIYEVSRRKNIHADHICYRSLNLSRKIIFHSSRSADQSFI